MILYLPYIQQQSSETAVEFRPRMRNSLKQKTKNIITYPCPNISWLIFIGVPGVYKMRPMKSGKI